MTFRPVPARPRLTRIALVLGLIALSVTTGQTRSDLKWQPVLMSTSVLANDELFPAQILAMTGRKASQASPRYIGDPNGMLGVVVSAPTPGTTVKVSIRIDGLAAESQLTATLPDAHQQYEIWPTMRFDSRALAAITQAMPMTAVYAVSANGESPAEQTRTLKVRSVNDVPYAFVQKDGRVLDTSYLFAGFVNESTPVAETIMRLAIDKNVVTGFRGYQGTPDQVMREVSAVWNVLQRWDVRYTSIITPSGYSGSVGSQHVRFPDETVKNRQANCVDGSVLIASVLYKLGINPILVKTPGHMFVGYYTDAAKTKPQFLETTLVGAQPLNESQRQWRYFTTDSYLSSASHQQFMSAVANGNARFQQARPSLVAKASNYALIDIDAARRSGISAIPRIWN